ncbi:TPA: hypothetical protein PVK60_000563 [Acinetobacter baumannii]|nr:hypothetical protein [Acinetobacter baumannii]HDI1577332.1 hypothetical protein [Acinetobacter baumannii]HDK8957562.1 hypothetical protein [Acinetobacter baumannii]
MTDLNKERELFVAFLRTKGILKIAWNCMGVITNIVREADCDLSYSDIEIMQEVWMEKAKAQAVPEKKIYLTCEQLYAAANFGAPNKDPELLETELTIAWFDEAHSGSGYYVYISEYPEEGAMKLERESGA